MNYQELVQSPIVPPQIVPLTQKAARSVAPVLIQGEHGTGKELVAKIIHYTGDWKESRFYKIDCRLLAEDKFKNQLLHVFTEINYGVFPATLYLKKIEYLDQSCQLKVLEIVEDGLFQNGDEKRSIKNIRFLSSSSYNLKEKVEQGKFSEDLYYRLSTISIFVPPLRDRPNDISRIAQYVLDEYSKKMKMERVEISNHVLMLLESYWWPGNLRELEHVIARSAIFLNGGKLMDRDLFAREEIENNSFSSFLKKTGMRMPSLKEKSYPEEQDSHGLSTFFLELIHRIKNPLVSIKTFTQLLREKFDDPEFRDYFYRVVTQDIEKIDSVLNGLTNYIKVVTPIEKTNTVHLVLEDILRKNAALLKSKTIKLFKKYEKNLPETVVHEEHLKYIFNSLLEFVILTIPPDGTIGLMTKSPNTHEHNDPQQVLPKEDKGFIDVMIVFTGYRKSAEQLKSVLGIPAPEQEEPIELELRLVKELIQQNRGSMKVEFNEKKSRTLISLKFPIERRKTVYYPSMNDE